MSFEALREEILEVMGSGLEEPLSEDRFQELALGVFRFQSRENRAYGGFVARRGVDPRAVTRWEAIPLLPTRAFKEAVLVAGASNRTERVFRTSGTTLGSGARGEHHVRDLSLYRASLLPSFQAHMLPGIQGEIRFLCLLPDPQVAADSSLSFMMGEAMRVWGADGSGFYWDPEKGVDFSGFRAALEGAQRGDRPVLVAGTAFAFAEWVTATREAGWYVALPGGSRIMETGGYKGRTTELPRGDLYGALTEALGVPAGFLVNEYGMTELLSQFYEPVLRRAAGLSGGDSDPSSSSLTGRFHVGPPWVRTRVLNPLNLQPVEFGEVGILAHVDLANLGSVSAILTEDLGRETGEGFQLLGRNPGSEPRGCSLVMEDFQASQERAR